ncbi:alpha/beta-hydrolase, partial [Scenedesmus sp. NREL 46B-D3]
TAVFLHGLLGSSRNWRSFSRKLAQDAAARTDRDVRMLLVDLRCHGASASRHGLHPPHSMASAADDVAQLIKQQLGGRAPHLLAGLSLGGKVALQLLMQMPPLRGLPQQVWVLDSQPGTVPLDVDAPTSVGKIIQLIHEIPTPLPNRQALYKYLELQGISLPIAQWLGTSLGNGANGDQQLDWAFDIQGAAALYHSYRLSSCWEVVARPPPGVAIHVVRGERSDRWTPRMLQQLAEAEARWRGAASAAPEAVGELQLHVLERAGHWLQADNPVGLAELMLPRVKD